MSVATLSLGSTSAGVPPLVFVPGGRFRMGSDDGLPDEWPVHDAQVRPVRMGRLPVTNLDYAWFLASGRVPAPPWWKDAGFWDPEQPVVGVTWFEAMSYCTWLGETLGGRWRLPTEAEWERAARGGLEGQPTPWGPEVPSDEIPAPPVSGPWPAGRGTPNGFGLLDIGTIVHEWCFDWYAANAYRATRRYDPRGSEKGERRVSRGGSWRSAGSFVPPSTRSSQLPQTRRADYGFRVVREVP